MLDYNKSTELMLAKEAAYMKELLEIPGVDGEMLAAMATLYRAGWRECWMEEAKARFKETTDIVDKIEAEDANGVWSEETD